MLTMVNGDEFDDTDELLSGEYVSIQPGEKKILQSYSPKEKPIEEVEKSGIMN